jgi:hypothetical protein
MNALTAPLLHVQRSDALWLVPAVPALGALMRAALAPEPDARGQAATRRVWALAPTAVAVLLLGSQLWALGSLEPDARLLFSPGPLAFRVGIFEASLGLALDPLAAVVAAAVAAIGVAAQGSRVDGRHAPAIDVAVSGALFALLSEGFLGLLIGSALCSVALATVAFEGGSATAALSLGRAGDAASSLGAVLLLWALGGSWGIALGWEPTYTRHNPAPTNVSQLDSLDSDDPDGPPALLPVLIGSAPPVASAAPKGAIPDLSAKGAITLAGMPGSKLFLKGAAESAGESPVVRREVYAGRIDVEVERASGKRIRYRALDVPAGREIALVTVGPTWSFRELRDQLAIEDQAHQKFVRNLLDPSAAGHRRIGAWGVGPVLAALLGLAGLCWMLTTAWAADALLGSVSGLLGVYFLARVEMVVVLSPMVSGVLATAAALVALLSALGALVHLEARRVAAHLSATSLAVAALAVFVGSPAFGVFVALLGVAGASLLAATLDALGAAELSHASDAEASAPRAARLLRVLALAIGGAPVPFLGAAFAQEAALGRAFGAEPPFAKAAAVVGGVAFVLAALSVFRVSALVCQGPRRRQPLAEPPARVVSGLLVAALALAALGPLAGMSRAFAGFALGGERSAIESFLDVGVDPAAVLGPDRAVRVDAGRALDLVVLALVCAGAFAAWFYAKRRYGGEDRRVPAPPSFGQGAAAIASAVAVFARLDELVFVRPLAFVADILSGARAGKKGAS